MELRPYQRAAIDAVYRYLRESDGELRDKFDAAIQSMKDDGSLNALLDKWEIGGSF